MTGITIDTFGALREETAARLETLQDTGFISDITRSEYDELGVEFSFDKLQNEDQNMWNYVFFLAHLRLKDDALFTGPETMVSNHCKVLDASWMPYKSSWAKQVAGDLDNKTKAETDVLANTVADIKHEQIRRFKTIEGAIGKLTTQMNMGMRDLRSELHRVENLLAPSADRAVPSRHPVST